MKICIIFVVLLAMLIGTGLAQNATSGDVKAFQKALEKDGFTVQKGELGSWDWLKLYDLGLLPSAYGGNPATKYLTYFVPPAPGHKVPEQLAKMARAFGVTSNLSSCGILVRMKPLFSWEEHRLSVDTSVSIIIYWPGHMGMKPDGSLPI
jgi:hypothetical protein